MSYMYGLEGLCMTHMYHVLEGYNWVIRNASVFRRSGMTGLVAISTRNYFITLENTYKCERK